MCKKYFRGGGGMLRILVPFHCSLKCHVIVGEMWRNWKIYVIIIGWTWVCLSFCFSFSLFLPTFGIPWSRVNPRFCNAILNVQNSTKHRSLWYTEQYTDKKVFDGYKQYIKLLLHPSTRHMYLHLLRIFPLLSPLFGLVCTMRLDQSPTYGHGLYSISSSCYVTEKY